MTLKTWLARALRRALATGAMLAGAEAALHRVVYASPEFPAADADRVEVWTSGGGLREVSDPGDVARILAFVGARRDGWMRVPGNVCFFNTSHAEFYRGGQMRGRVLWSERSLGLAAGAGFAWFR